MTKVDSQHNPHEIYVNLFVPMTRLPDKTVVRYNFYKADYNELNAHISSIDWCSRLEQCTNCEVAVDTLYHELRRGFAMFVPKKKSRWRSSPTIIYAKA